MEQVSLQTIHEDLKILKREMQQIKLLLRIRQGLDDATKGKLRIR